MEYLSTISLGAYHQNLQSMRSFAFFSAILLGSLETLTIRGSLGRADPSSIKSATATDTPDIMAQIAGDMLGMNEGHPHGIPSNWGFYAGPSISDGNHASTSCNNGPCKAMDYWGTVYVDALGNSSSNTRVSIRNCQAFWLNSSTNRWTKWGPDTTPQGVEDYPEKFDGPTTPTNVKMEPDKSMSVLPASGKTSHFYGPYPRIPIDPDFFAGVVSVCEMRLVLDNPAGPDDRAVARFLGNVGGDFYPGTTGAGILNNRGIGGGKFKYIKSDWRSFAMTTLPEKQLKSNPPPVTLAGAAP
jgi:hypothetical protein